MLVASARYTALSPDGGGTPSSPGGGTPQSPWKGGTWDGVPPIQSWVGVTPLSIPGMGYSPIQTWDGVPPPYQDLG